MKILKTFMFLSVVLFQLNSYGAAEEKNEKAPYRVTSTTPHDMKIINSGSASLYARLDMIKRAKHTIELETFIFSKDTSGRAIMKELVAAAKRGVKVRVLIDKAIINIKYDAYDAKFLKENGVDLRFYNDSSILNLSTTQYRNHRKQMIIDDNEVITGGRNISDEYFDLNKDFNFLDRDATVEGPVVSTMRETFDKFWNSKMTETPKLPTEPEPYHPSVDGGDAKYENEMAYYKKKTREARALLNNSEEDENKIKFIMEAGKEAFDKDTKKHACPEISFATDREGAGFVASLSDRYHKRYRHLRKEISKWMKDKTTNELMIDTPYFLNNNFTEDIDKKLKNNIKVTVFTNSVASTDAIHVASVFNGSINQFTPSENFTAYTYKGVTADEGKTYNDRIRDGVWGTHSKSMVFNDNAFMIGTYNMDNRSSHYNAEMAIFCSGSKELTADVKNNIIHRTTKSNRLNAEGLPDDCSGLFGEVKTKKKLFYYLLKIPSYFLQSLL